MKSRNDAPALTATGRGEGRHTAPGAPRPPWRSLPAKGYHAARMDAIAEAGRSVSKGALYFHLSGKLPLFSALVDELAGELGADVAAAIAAHQGRRGPRWKAAVTAALSLFWDAGAPSRASCSSRRRARARLRDEAPGDPRPLRCAGAHHLDEAVAEGASRRLDSRRGRLRRGSARSTRSRCSRSEGELPRPRGRAHARCPPCCSAPSAGRRRARSANRGERPVPPRA
jgi:AcrR family transcriptional regulator